MLSQRPWAFSSHSCSPTFSTVTQQHGWLVREGPDDVEASHRPALGGPSCRIQLTALRSTMWLWRETHPTTDVNPA